MRGGALWRADCSTTDHHAEWCVYRSRVGFTVFETVMSQRYSLGLTLPEHRFDTEYQL